MSAVLPAVTPTENIVLEPPQVADTQHPLETRDGGILRPPRPTPIQRKPFVVGDICEYHALCDYRTYKAKRGRIVELIEVEWNGGVKTWHHRKDIETDDCADDICVLVLWHSGGRKMPLALFRRAYFGRKPRYTAGESGLCGFVATKAAFNILGHQWVTDDLVAEYIKGGDKRNKNYREGITWEQLIGFIRFFCARLQNTAVHPCVKTIAKNLRAGPGAGRSGVHMLTSDPGVYLVGFSRACVAHFVAVETRMTGERLVYDDGECFSLEANDWIDSSQLVRVHRVAIK